MVTTLLNRFDVRSRVSAFTIVELLVVIGIIGVLAVTLLALLNPAEAQRRSRDAKRLRDANTLQAIVNQYLEDGNTFGTACTTTTPCTSSSAGNVDTAPCSTASNWLGGTNADLCSYAQAIPVDPVNGTGSCVTATGTVSTSCSDVYRVAVTGRTYEINVRQESVNNDSRVTGDSGDSTQWVEVFNGTNDLMTN